MNGVTLPAMPFGANILLPPVQGPVTTGAAYMPAFRLPDFDAVTAPLRQAETGAAEDASPEKNAPGAELLFQLAGLIVPSQAAVTAPLPAAAVPAENQPVAAPATQELVAAPTQYPLTAAPARLPLSAPPIEDRPVTLSTQESPPVRNSLTAALAPNPFIAGHTKEPPTALPLPQPPMTAPGQGAVVDAPAQPPLTAAPAPPPATGASVPVPPSAAGRPPLIIDESMPPVHEGGKAETLARSPHIAMRVNTPVAGPLPAAEILAPLVVPDADIERPAFQSSAPFVQLAVGAIPADGPRPVLTKVPARHVPGAELPALTLASAKPALREADLPASAGTVAATVTASDTPGTLTPASPAVFETGAAVAPAPDQLSLAGSQSQIVDRALDFAREDLWLGELAKDIVALGDGAQPLSFRLLPRALGQLDVSIAPSDKGLSIHMSASSEDARSIVASAQPRLVDEIRSQGVRVADASVDHGGTNDGRGGSAAEGRPPLIEIALPPAEPEESTTADADVRGLFA